MAGKSGFFLRLAAAGGITLLLFCALQWIYATRVVPKMNVSKSESQFQAMGLHAEILICGDSHAAYDLNPAQVPGSFNYALPSETIEQTFYKLRRALPEMPDLKLIIMPLDLHTFSNYRQRQFADIWYWSDFITVRELAAITGKSAAALWIFKVFPFIGNGEEFKGMASGGGTEVIKGWQKHSENFAMDTEKPLSGRKRAGIHFPNYPQAIDSTMLEFLSRILALTRERHVPVLLLKFPVTPQYLQAVDAKRIDRAAYYRKVEGIAAAAGGATIWDYQGFIAQDSLFNDPDHLNSAGAGVFSAEIAGRLGKSGLLPAR